ncbi:MAG: hypothetical protein SGCHY_003813 [Lobulomycetales sp.]
MRKKLADAVARWKYIGNERPDFAIVPAEGEESVWLYPRPPACLPAKARITVRDPKDGSLIASAETSSPPVFCVPPSDVSVSLLEIPGRSSICEFKGAATYLALPRAASKVVAWTYRHPEPEYLEIQNFVAFYPSAVDCFLGEEQVKAQKSDYYGGWVFKGLVGPWKEGRTQAWEMNS